MEDCSDIRYVPRVGVPSTLIADPGRFGGIPDGDLLCGTLVVKDGRAITLMSDAGHAPAERLVLPRLAEVHVHLDKCHSVDRCQNIGGDLKSASAAQLRDKAVWTEEDLTSRAHRGVQELINAGCGVVRTHVDWSATADNPDTPPAWDVIGALADQVSSTGLVLQRSALTAVDEMSDRSRAERVARRVAAGHGTLGSFVLDQPHREKGMRNLFALAQRFGLPLDFHVDEGLSPDLDGLELIADIALETRHDGPVLCGHACSLASKSIDDVHRIADKLAKAEIAIAALPTTNLYLQGRRDGTPDRRGITRLQELAARGVTIVIGTDNVRDAFFPLGRHDPLHSLSVAVMAGHLDPPFGRHLPMITTAARHALGLPSLAVDGALTRDLLTVPGKSLSDLLSGATAPVPLDDILGVPYA